MLEAQINQQKRSTMSIVIGMFSSDKDVLSSIEKLKKAGLAEAKIGVLTHYNAARKLLSSDQIRRVIPHIGWGALFVFAIFCLIGLAVDWYACCNFFGYGMMFWVGGAVGLAGAVLGAAAGWFFGLDKIERETEFYSQGVGKGGQLITVQTNDQLVTKVMDILRQQDAVGVKTLKGL
jgi:hypothetical protein